MNTEELVFILDRDKMTITPKMVRAINLRTVSTGATFHLIGETAFLTLEEAQEAWQVSKARKVAKAQQALRAAMELTLDM